MSTYNVSWVCLLTLLYMGGGAIIVGVVKKVKSFLFNDKKLQLRVSGILCTCAIIVKMFFR